MFTEHGKRSTYLAKPSLLAIEVLSPDTMEQYHSPFQVFLSTRNRKKPDTLGNAVSTANTAGCRHFAAFEMQNACIHKQPKRALVFLCPVMVSFSNENESCRGNTEETWGITGHMLCLVK